jgi:hypothetical protein
MGESSIFSPPSIIRETLHEVSLFDPRPVVTVVCPTRRKVRRSTPVRVK